MAQPKDKSNDHLYTRIVVLNDGTTWTTAAGCKVIMCKESEIELAMDEDRVPEGTVLHHFNSKGAYI
jgi:hypothetical protein